MFGQVTSKMRLMSIMVADARELRTLACDYETQERKRQMDINTYKDSNELAWIFVQKWGKTYVAPMEKPSWIFNFSPTQKKHWKYVKELDVWRSNVSAL